MAKRIEYSRAAVKMLARIDRATSELIRAKIRLLASDPDALANNITALKGGQGKKRLKVGDWRVIFTEDLLVLTIVRVAPRASAYD